MKRKSRSSSLQEQTLPTSDPRLRSLYESDRLRVGVVEVHAVESDQIHDFADRFFNPPPVSDVEQSAGKFGVPEETVRCCIHQAITNYRLAEREGRPVQFEYWHPQESGAVCLSTAVKRIGPGDSERTMFLYAVTDVTERKRVEEAMRRSESTLRSFYESAPLMMGVVDVAEDDSEIIHVYDNPATDRFFGRSPGSTAGQSALKLGAPKEAMRHWIEHYRLAEREGRPVQFEYWHQQNGGAVYLSAVVARIGPGDSGRTRFSYAVADMTERKRVEEALQASEERLVLASVGGNLGIWDWNIAQNKACLSPKYYEIMGYPEGEVQPDLQFFRGLVHAEDLAPLESALRDHLEGKSDYSVSEYRIRRKTGRYRWIREVGKVVARDKKGAPLRITGVIADITVQKNAERILREQLAHASRVSTMGELASSIAHELSQPLGAIGHNIDAAELYLNQTPPALDDLSEIMSDLRKATQRAGEVIHTMRTMLLKQEIEPQPLEINLLTEEVVRFVKDDAVSRRIEITTEFSPQLPGVRGNRVQLQQVILNFVMNAMDAMVQQPAGRRSLTVGTSLATDGGVQLSVSDSGPGIEPRNLQRLFQPFFTTKKSGLGIGLSVAEKIVTAHNGRIWAENRPAGGAVFHLVLPAERQPAGVNGKRTATGSQ